MVGMVAITVNIPVFQEDLAAVVLLTRVVSRVQAEDIPEGRLIGEQNSAQQVVAALTMLAQIKSMKVASTRDMVV